jgi:hypothetical protein
MAIVTNRYHLHRQDGKGRIDRLYSIKEKYHARMSGRRDLDRR